MREGKRKCGGGATHVSLRHRLVRVGAADATRHRSHGAEAGPQGGNHGPVPTMRLRVLRIGLDDLRVRWLQVLATRRLDFDDGFVQAAGRRAVGHVAEGRFAGVTVHDDKGCRCL